jgi:hypothetical protein
MEPVSFYAPEQLTFIRTIGKKHGLSDEEIEAKQRGYSRGLADTRIWLSEPGQIEGYRRLALAGIGEHKLLAYAVTDAGGLILKECALEGSRDVPLGVLIEDLIEQTPYWGTSASYLTSFDINHYTRDAQWLRGVLCDNRLESLREGDWGSDAQNGFYAEMKGAIISRAGRNGGGIRKAIKEALNPDMVKAVWGARATDYAHLTWFSGTSDDGIIDTMDADVLRSRQRCRLQAFTAYPSLLPVLRLPQITKVIDAQEPLVEALSTITELPEAKLKLLHGKGAKAVGNPLLSGRVRLEVVHNAPAAALHGLKFIDEKSLPRRGSDWRKLWQTDDVIHSVFSIISDGYDVSDEDRKALRVKRAHAQRTYLPRYETFADEFPELTAGHYADMINSVSVKLVVPAVSLKLPKDSRMLQVHMNTLVKKDFLLRSSFKDIQAASMRWHRNLASIEDSLGSTKWGGLETSWRGLLSDRRVEGYDVKEITSDAGLTRRGRTENHCVGGYGPMVRAAGTENNFSLIYAVDGAETSLTTIEVKVTVDEERKASFAINQNLGTSNAPPHADAEKVAAEILKALEKMSPERLQTYRSRMRNTEQARANNFVGFTAMERQCGVGFTKPGYLEAAWDEMQQYLPRSLRKAGLEEVANIFTSQEIITRENLDARRNHRNAQVERIHHQYHDEELDEAMPF